MDKLYTYLGFAAKAGKILAGSSRVAAAIKNNQVFLVICATDLSPKTIKNFRFLCESRKIPFYCYGSLDIIGKTIGKPKRGVLGVVSSSFSEIIKKLL